LGRGGQRTTAAEELLGFARDKDDPRAEIEHAIAAEQLQQVPLSHNREKK